MPAKHRKTIAYAKTEEEARKATLSLHLFYFPCYGMTERLGQDSFEDLEGIVQKKA